MGYWTGLHGILDRTTWDTGHDYMRYWTGLHGSMDRTTWDTGQDYMGYWTGLHGSMDRIVGKVSRMVWVRARVILY